MQPNRQVVRNQPVRYQTQLKPQVQTVQRQAPSFFKANPKRRPKKHKIPYYQRKKQIDQRVSLSILITNILRRESSKNHGQDQWPPSI